MTPGDGICCPPHTRIRSFAISSVAMIFRQLIDSETSTFTYLLGDRATGEAVLIDCVFEQHLRDLAMIRELNLKLLYTVETHVHADHVTGAWLMKQAIGSQIAVAAAAGAEGADLQIRSGDSLEFGKLRLEARATPGHTNGCMSFVHGDGELAFTGDALLIRGAGRTDFQGGSAPELFRSVREQLFSLPSDCLLYPGHDYNGRTVTTVAEERVHNPRLGDGVREEDFVGYMDNLGLPHPQRMEAAVPANLRCGEPSDPASGPQTPNWGPVIRTFAGVWQIESDWVHQNIDNVYLVDVREREEVVASPMGLVPGSHVIPLRELRERVGEVPHDRPVICICPAGARSAAAAGIIEKAGVPEVANLRGGILAWRSAGLPIEQGDSR